MIRNGFAQNGEEQSFSGEIKLKITDVERWKGIPIPHSKRDSWISDLPPRESFLLEQEMILRSRERREASQSTKEK